MTWVIYLQAAAIAVVFTRGGLFKPLREHGPKLWRELVSCAMCSGWWIGGFAQAWSIRLAEPPYSLSRALEAAASVVGAGAVVGVLGLITTALFDFLASRAELNDAKAKEITDLPAEVKIHRAKVEVMERAQALHERKAKQDGERA